jgi:hypothetical protein
LSPVAHESHLDRFVRQLEGPFRSQELADLQTVELLCQLEEAEYPDLELVIAHWSEAWTD